MEIHASQISAYKTCPRMYRYAYVDMLVPKQEDKKLTIGTIAHKALAAYYLNGTPPRQVVAEEAAKLEDPPEELSVLEKLMDRYPAWARENDTFRTIGVEVEFRVPIHYASNGRQLPKAYHAGRLDGVCMDPYGSLWLMEHKTASQFPSEDYLRLDEQAGFYLLAATRLYPNQRLVGVQYTVIRKTDPDRARGDVFARYRVLRNRHELESLRKNLYYSYNQIVRERYFLPHPGQHCTWQCAYRMLCLAENDGTPLRELANEFYERRETA